MARLFDDASTQYLEIASVIGGTPPFTMACWAYFDDLDAVSTMMAIGDVGANADFYTLDMAGVLANDPIRAGVQAGVNFSASIISSAISLNTWHHVAGVFTSTSSRTAFVDGVNGVENTSFRSPTGLDRTAIGRLPRLTSTNYMSGRIAEAAIWNAQLTGPEITAMSQGYSPLFIRPESLLAYWPIIGRYSPEIDIVGGNGLTVTGATAVDHPRIILPSRRNRIFVPTAVASSVPPRKLTLLGVG